MDIDKWKKEARIAIDGEEIERVSNLRRGHIFFKNICYIEQLQSNALFVCLVS